jgi:hypothetical protein
LAEEDRAVVRRLPEGVVLLGIEERVLLRRGFGGATSGDEQEGDDGKPGAHGARRFARTMPA